MNPSGRLAKEETLSKGSLCPVMTLLLPNSLECSKKTGRLAFVLAPILVFFSSSQCLGNQKEDSSFSCV
jgi:hypothetical protein